MHHIANLSSMSISRKKRRRERQQTQFWIRPGRTSAWWDNFVNGIVVEEEWKENFRMSKSTFTKLCDDLSPLIQRKQTSMRTPVSVEKQVAVTLYYLSDEGPMRKVSNAFGLSRASISILVRRVTQDINFIRT